MDPQLIEEVTVDGAPFTLVHRDIQIDTIELDERNPRIQYRLGLQRGPKSLDEVILGMPEVKKLRDDIAHNKGLREKIIVQEMGEGTYKVLEGNCRTVCFRSLRKMPKYEDAGLWDTIPARVVSADMEERKIAILLSDMHVSGKIQWKAHEKAGQIFRMSRELGMAQGDIAVYLRASKTTVNRLLEAYALMQETFLTVDDGAYADKGEYKWSFFDELYRSRDLRDELKRNHKFGEQFCRWVGEERLPDGADVRKLPAILKHPEAREALETRPKDVALQEAVRIVEKSDPEIGSDLFQQLRKLRETCTDVGQVKEILRIRTDPVAQDKVMETYMALRNFMLLADLDPDRPEADAAE